MSQKHSVQLELGGKTYRIVPVPAEGEYVMIFWLLRRISFPRKIKAFDADDLVIEVDDATTISPRNSIDTLYDQKSR